MCESLGNTLHDCSAPVSSSRSTGHRCLRPWVGSGRIPTDVRFCAPADATCPVRPVHGTSSETSDICDAAVARKQTSVRKLAVRKLANGTPSAPAFGIVH